MAVVAVAAIGLTTAFFSDTEISTGNTFTAGAIDLKIDSQCSYNGQESEECGSWELKDLEPTSDKFFNFSDVKPGDEGENTISIHVINNDAWVCVAVSNLADYENNQTEPEAEVDGTDGELEGELSSIMLWTVWRDDGDNLLEDGEDVLAEGNPINGTLALYDSNTGTGPLSAGSTGYLGVSWNLPGESGNETQTDGLTGDISFYVEQSRNNENFRCDGVEEHGWIEKNPEAPFNRRFTHVSLVKDGKIWILGGYGDSGVLNDVWHSNTSDGTNWIQEPDASWVPRGTASGVIYNGKMWIMGGFDSSFDELNDVWSSTDGINWTQETASAPWHSRQGASAVVYNGKMWIMGGGIDGTGSFYAVNDVWSSTDGINWTEETASAPWTARRYAALVNFNGKMYLIGGLDSGNNPFNDVWSSIDGVNWTEETNSAAWTERGGHQVVVYQNELWLMGGEIPHYPSVNTEHFNDVWSSADGVNWTQEADALWDEREFLSAVVAGSNIWVVAGGQNLPIFGDVWKYSN